MKLGDHFKEIFNLNQDFSPLLWASKVFLISSFRPSAVGANWCHLEAILGLLAHDSWPKDNVWPLGAKEGPEACLSQGLCWNEAVMNFSAFSLSQILTLLNTIISIVCAMTNIIRRVSASNETIIT